MSVLSTIRALYLEAYDQDYNCKWYLHLTQTSVQNIIASLWLINVCLVNNVLHFQTSCKKAKIELKMNTKYALTIQHNYVC